VFALLLGSLALVLALEYRPSWYRPVELSESHLQLARMEALRVVDSIGDRLVEGEPFEVILSDDQLNIWMAGLGQIWPEAAQRIPREIYEPYLDFEPGLLRVAARVETDGWRAIITTRYTFELSEDSRLLRIELASASCGCLGIPESLVSTALPSPIRVDGESYSVQDFFDGLNLANRFVWPNGRRSFRFGDIKIDSGSIRLRIEPL